MTGYDAQRYEYTKEKATQNGMKVNVHGDSFLLASPKKNYGRFPTLEELFQFLCGYEAAKGDSI